MTLDHPDISNITTRVVIRRSEAMMEAEVGKEVWRSSESGRDAKMPCYWF
jgi:hypothetical protein